MPSMAVNLHLFDGTQTRVCVDINQYGQLPAVIVDPRTEDGGVLPGTWLGESHNSRPDGTSYRAVPRHDLAPTAKESSDDT